MKQLAESDNIKIRRDILTILYQHFKNSERFTEGAVLLKAIGKEKNELYPNLRYLEDKDLVNIIWRPGGFPVVKITALGIDLLEDESEFNQKFPLSINYDSSIHISDITGDITGIGISGSNNVIEKNIQISDSFNIENNLLSTLPQKYADAFKKFNENISYQFKQNNISEGKAKEVNNTISELVKETQGVKPDEEPKLLKQQKWRERFFKVLENILHILPKTAETIAIFTPLAPFSKLIGNTIEKVVEEVQKEL
jgi:DNA-binding PadR family transcriptional regulator